jgi:hypothetical protein
MTVAGFHLSLTLVLQLVTTAIILGLYATTTSMQEQKADHLSRCSMMLLSAFVFDHSQSLKDLQALLPSPPDKAEENWVVQFFRTSMHEFKKTGRLLDLERAAGTTLAEHLIVIVTAPLSAFVITLFLRSEVRETSRITCTSYRQNIVSKFMVMLSANVIEAILLEELLLRHNAALGKVLLTLPLVGILSCLAAFAIMTMDQQNWKAFWSDQPLEIMALAAQQDDHDLFNRAMLLKNNLEAQPNLPLPGQLGLYTTVFSVVQGVILFASRTLHLS